MAGTRVQMLQMLQMLQMVNECFGVGVVSESGMTSAGVEPRMVSSTD